MKIPLTKDSFDTWGSDMPGSYPGMAHFAGTGPAGNFCRECRHFIARRGKKSETICAKYRELMRRIGPAIPGHAEACRHFEK